jgi:hypothetical protein
MDKNKLISIFSLMGLLLANFVSAATYPTINGITIGKDTTASEYVAYFFNLAIAAGAFIAGVMLVVAGIDFASSQGDSIKLGDAKRKVRNIFLGLAVLLSAFWILNVINPRLTTITIDQLKEGGGVEIEIPEGTGIYLYNSPNYVSTVDPVRVIETEPSVDISVQSMKFVNPDSGDFKFGTVLFAKNEDTSMGSGADLRGNCTYAFNSIADMNSSSGDENNPPIGKNNLSSMVVFKTDGGTSSVTFYNSINCTKGTDEFEERKDEEIMCTVSGKDFTNISDACPNFKGEVMSIKTSGDVGVLLKVSKKDAAGRCQYLESNKTGCINTVKYSYAYKLKESKYEPTVYPQSFAIFSLVK